jgi:pyridoxal phosphate enzyme (YggS family)
MAIRGDPERAAPPLDEAPDADPLRRNLAAVRAEIEAACRRAGRDPGEVRLLPIVKVADAAAVRRLYRLGLREFGESTVQEALRKRQALADLKDLRWQLVGHLQTNKAGKALELFEAIHSLDSERLAEALDRRLAARGGPPPRLFVEVNVAGEAAKTGLPPDRVLPLLEAVRARAALAPGLAGLMAIAPMADNPEDARPHFRRLRELRDRAAAAGLLPTGAGLSMGMSADFQAAILEGATIVRIGSRLFEGLDGGAESPNEPT